MRATPIRKITGTPVKSSNNRISTRGSPPLCEEVSKTRFELPSILGSKFVHLSGSEGSKFAHLSASFVDANSNFQPHVRTVKSVAVIIFLQFTKKPAYCLSDFWLDETKR
ncbi:hypothetical protein QL285_074239 [Trifolium repens]|nr:hypothetical protein QL285_074239 [Trifolium repens]